MAQGNSTVLPEAPEGIPEFHNFTVDAALFRELGERLVGRPHVALAELVKNAYDADASEVLIDFSNDSITVTDNGHGMTRDEFLSFWMRVGTTHKQRDFRSKRLDRQVTGSKGVGRLSAQFLGDTLQLRTIAAGEQRVGVRADVDWRDAKASGDLIKAGATVRNLVAPAPLANRYRTGVQVRIGELKHAWGQQELQELARELWFLRPPRALHGDLGADDDFVVRLLGVSADDAHAFAKQMEQALDNWIAIIEGSLNGARSGGSMSVSVRFRDEDAYRAEVPSNGRIDRVNFRIFVFNLSGRQAGGISVNVARDYFKKFGGVHIYDESFRLPFYGGDTQDWLQLEIDHSHRLTRSRLLPDELQTQSGLNDLPSNGRIFGLVRISTAHERREASDEDLQKGDYLNVQVTRDRLIDNDAYEELVRLVRWSIDYYANRSFERRQKTIAARRLEIPEILPQVSELAREIESIREVAPSHLATRLSNLSERFSKLEVDEVNRTAALGDERILLAALATTGMAAIALEHEFGKDLTTLEVISKRLRAVSAGVESDDLNFILQAIDSWVARSSGARRLFSPLMNEYDRSHKASFKAKGVVESVVKNSFALLRNIAVETSDVPASLRLPEATLAAWNAIVQNVLINSVNAMINSKERHIRCYGEIDSFKSTASLTIEDSGVGVDLENSTELFKPFVRKLKLPKEVESLGLGGTGLGLTIVKIVADSLTCRVRFKRPSSAMATAFELSWSTSKDAS